MDTADRDRRELLPDAPTVSIARERYELAIWAELIHYINEHTYAGGRYRTHGDGGEAGLGRLKAEHDYIENRCRQAKIPFQWDAFQSLYSDDLALLPQAPLGRPRKDGSAVVPVRMRTGMTMAVDIVRYANNVWVKRGTCKRLANVVELGILRRRRGGHRLESDAEEPTLTLPPEEFWKAYLAALARLRQQT